MFNDLSEKYSPYELTDVSEERVNADVAAVFARIEMEECTMTKRKFRFKPLIIAAAVMVTLTLSLVTVNAATNGGLIKFLFGGNEYEGDVYDYIDNDGYRHIGYTVELPTYEETYAVFYDIDAPMEERVRAITEESDPEFFEKVRAYHEAMLNTPSDTDVTEVPKPEDFGLVCKPSELCHYRIGTIMSSGDGMFGGEFMFTGAAAGKPSGSGDFRDEGDGKTYGDSNGYGAFYDLDYETDTYGDTKIVKDTFYYYVGTNDSQVTS